VRTVLLPRAARLISIETGSILSAPSASADKKGTVDTIAALVQLVDQDVDAVSTELSAKISGSAQAEVAAHAAPLVPKFVGIEDGLTVINKGAIAGIKVRDRFNVMRPADTGLKDPDTGQAILRKKKVCALVISVVEDTIASGSCDGGLPEKGDELAPATAQ
jgi:hypothetical protein